MKYSIDDEVKVISGPMKGVVGLIDKVLQRHPDDYDYVVELYNGSRYCVYESEIEPIEPVVSSSSVSDNCLDTSISKKIKSDGGSSSYYDLKVSKKLLQKLLDRDDEGECYIKTEEIIAELFCNDFDFGTLFKSLVRGYLQTKGAGKAGNDLEYEMNKVLYYANKIKEKHDA